jgi:hypothetical protein
MSNNPLTKNTPKRVTFVSNPNEEGEQQVISVAGPERVITGKIRGNKGEFSIPYSMWNQEDLTKLVRDMEAAEEDK